MGYVVEASLRFRKTLQYRGVKVPVYQVGMPTGIVAFSGGYSSLNLFVLDYVPSVVFNLHA